MKNITVAKSWAELNAWQLQEIVDLYLNFSEENFQKSFDQMIIILFQKKKGFWNRLKLRKLLFQVPISELYQFGQFLLELPKLHKFPPVDGLVKPADRLGDITVKHFSFMDQFFNTWMDTKSDKFLRALCASVYRLSKSFDEQDLPLIAKHTDKLSRKQKQVIGFTYMSCYYHISDTFEVVFPKPKVKEGEEKKKVKKTTYKPFSEVILNVAMNDKQPLGNLHSANDTRIYEFLNVLTKILIQLKEDEKNARK